MPFTKLPSKYDAAWAVSANVISAGNAATASHLLKRIVFIGLGVWFEYDS